MVCSSFTEFFELYSFSETEIISTFNGHKIVLLATAGDRSCLCWNLTSTTTQVNYSFDLLSIQFESKVKC